MLYRELVERGGVSDASGSSPLAFRLALTEGMWNGMLMLGIELSDLELKLARNAWSPCMLAKPEVSALECTGLSIKEFVEGLSCFEAHEPMHGKGWTKPAVDPPEAEGVRGLSCIGVQWWLASTKLEGSAGC